MKNLLIAAAVLFAAAARADDFKMIGAKELDARLKSANPPAVFDANGESTRKKAGIIPGAALLSSSQKYDVAKELPADHQKPLAFYCANTMCTASHEAAKRAVAAGYGDVSVMSDGIAGWKDAGFPTAPAHPKKAKAKAEKKAA